MTTIAPRKLDIVCSVCGITYTDGHDAHNCMRGIAQRLAALEAQFSVLYYRVGKCENRLSPVSIGSGLEPDKPTDTPPVAPEYRMLKVGEAIRDGDHYYEASELTWKPVGFFSRNEKVTQPEHYRRRIVPDEKPVADGRGDAECDHPTETLSNPMPTCGKCGKRVEKKSPLQWGIGLPSDEEHNAVLRGICRDHNNPQPHELKNYYVGLSELRAMPEVKRLRKERDDARAELDRVRNCASTNASLADEIEQLRKTNNAIQAMYNESNDKHANARLQVRDFQSKLAAAEKNAQADHNAWAKDCQRLASAVNTVDKQLARIRELEKENERLRKFHAMWNAEGLTVGTRILIEHVACQEAWLAARADQ